MMLDFRHYAALFVAYAATMAGVVCARRMSPRAWRTNPPQKSSHPWREFGYAMIAAVGILLVGQLYQRGIRLPSSGKWGVAAEMTNQVFIFCPMILLLIVRRHPMESAWLPRKTVAAHVATGLALAGIAIVVFTMIRQGTMPPHQVIGRVFRPSHADKLIQVFLEDMSMAILLVRLGAALRSGTVAAVLVAFLFAAGHVPAMLSQGAGATELGRLCLDFALAAIVLLTVQRTASIWWFVWVHFAMDMMQFPNITDR